MLYKFAEKVLYGFGFGSGMGIAYNLNNFCNTKWLYVQHDNQ